MCFAHMMEMVHAFHAAGTHARLKSAEKALDVKLYEAIREHEAVSSSVLTPIIGNIAVNSSGTGGGISGFSIGS